MKRIEKSLDFKGSEFSGSEFSSHPITICTAHVCLSIWSGTKVGPLTSVTELKKNYTAELLRFLFILQAIFVALLALFLTVHSLFPVIINFKLETSRALT